MNSIKCEIVVKNVPSVVSKKCIMSWSEVPKHHVTSLLVVKGTYVDSRKANVRHIEQGSPWYDVWLCMSVVSWIS